MSDEPTPPLDESEPIRTIAARRLGVRMDGCLLAVSRLPWQIWTVLCLVALVATWPRGKSRFPVFGLVLEDKLSVWMARVVGLGVLTLILVLCWFFVRAVLRYVEQDRWPRRAGVVEMDELSQAQKQLDADAHALSHATDEVRILGKSLAEARETIVFLQGELERESSYGQREDDDEPEQQAGSE